MRTTICAVAGITNPAARIRVVRSVFIMPLQRARWWPKRIIRVMPAVSNLVLLLLAAVSFTAGGVSMKYSQGLTQVGPSVLVAALFLIGAACQALAMRRED